jgi:DNA-binding IclR family transcriptional regulator
MGKVDDQIISVLEKSKKPLSLVEIADQVEKPTKTVFKSLRKLFEEGKIECDIKNHQYMLAKK